MTNATSAASAATSSEIWTGLIAGGITHAISGLGDLVGEEVRTTFISPRTLPASQVNELIGGPETDVVAIHLGVKGEATGHILVMFKPATAFELVNMLLDREPGSAYELDELALSTMGEMGNVMGAYFLSALGDATGVRLMPSPPTVMMDMAGAVIDAAVADIMGDGDDILVVETRFGTANQQIHGIFLVLPNPQLKEVLLDRWAKQ
ncbi:MAG: chemotaxis protein CheX [Chloroflexi bacterium]|nr:chemotaxis protein CheX [Chloroflexota bacterium]MCH8222322.1 chemotaxis protein CheX [Chloroflexota bacterium]